MTGWFATLLLAAIWVCAPPRAVAQGQASGSAAAPRGNAENGKKLFNTIGCWQCHGYSGQGGAAPKIAPDPVPFAGFLAYVRKPAGSMPPYSPKMIPDSDLADIYAFLLSIPKPPDPDSIPLLRSE
jgi:mono/diheme cytochrome c family protein